MCSLPLRTVHSNVEKFSFNVVETAVLNFRIILGLETELFARSFGYSDIYTMDFS